MASGWLDVTVVGCRSLEDVEVYGKQDPYLVLQCGDQQHRTKTHRDGHLTPVWNETFQVQLKAGVDAIKCGVWDQNKIGKDVLIGQCSVNVQPALTAGVWDTWHPLFTKKQKQKGNLRLVLKYLPAPPYGYPYAPTPAPYAYGAALQPYYSNYRTPPVVVVHRHGHHGYYGKHKGYKGYKGGFFFK
ncbi:hypothetical protein CLOM_g23142 [Closterium sp. NIES-68]|nr:hypothetical protein CLOM_g23142 [Closterium sp. NIES-68]